jgi:DNA polymerase-3 subunit alpha
VIDYVVQKYGKNQVAQIVTYGTMAAKMSIKDVARVMDLPLSESNALAKLVPEKPGTKLYRVLHAPLTQKKAKPRWKKKKVTAATILKIKRLRGMYITPNRCKARCCILPKSWKVRYGTPAFMLPVSSLRQKTLTELIPVFASKDTDLCITQIEGSIIEDSGVIKMDFLGLKTLSIIRDALR